MYFAQSENGPCFLQLSVRAGVAHVLCIIGISYHKMACWSYLFSWLIDALFVGTIGTAKRKIRCFPISLWDLLLRMYFA